MKLMTGRQADKLALGVTGLIGFLWAGITLHSWIATAASGASLLAVLQVLAEVFLAGGESGDATTDAHETTQAVGFHITTERPE